MTSGNIGNAEVEDAADIYWKSRKERNLLLMLG